LPASTPVLFLIDGDPGAAHALRDDLSRRFGREFRIVCESAANAGLAALRELAVRRVPVALLVELDLYSVSSAIAWPTGPGTPKPPSTCSASSASTTAPGTNYGNC
jgi:hypothetical protein